MFSVMGDYHWQENMSGNHFIIHQVISGSDNIMMCHIGYSVYLDTSFTLDYLLESRLRIGSPEIGSFGRTAYRQHKLALVMVLLLELINLES